MPRFRCHFDQLLQSRVGGIVTFMDIDLALRAIRNPARRRILHWLKCPKQHFPPPPLEHSETTGVRMVHIHAKSGLSQSTVSHYLNLLEQAGLIVRERHGSFVFFRRHESNIALFIRALVVGLGPETPPTSDQEGTERPPENGGAESET